METTFFDGIDITIPGLFTVIGRPAGDVLGFNVPVSGKVAAGGKFLRFMPTTVGLDSGQAIVISRQTGQSVLLNVGEKVTIKSGGEMGSITLGKVEGCPG